MTKTDKAKERLRQHLTHLNATGYIDPYQLIRDKVYYYKEVMPALKILGIVNDSGMILKPFDVDAFIHALHETKRKQIKQISPRRAKAIGSKIVKRTLQDAIEQNQTIGEFMDEQATRLQLDEAIKTAARKLPIMVNPSPSYVDRATFDDNELVFDYKPQKITLTDEQLFDELKARGWSGELMRNTKVKI